MIRWREEAFSSKVTWLAVFRFNLCRRCKQCVPAQGLSTHFISPLLCSRHMLLDTCSMLLTVYSTYLLISISTLLWTWHRLLQPVEHVSKRCRESLEDTPFLFPPPPWCFISLTLTFAVPGSWFTHLWFVKLQHGCALKESGHAINHRKCQLLLLASSVRLLMRQS